MSKNGNNNHRRDRANSDMSDIGYVDIEKGLDDQDYSPKRAGINPNVSDDNLRKHIKHTANGSRRSFSSRTSDKWEGATAAINTLPSDSNVSSVSHASSESNTDTVRPVDREAVRKEDNGFSMSKHPVIVPVLAIINFLVGAHEYIGSFFPKKSEPEQADEDKKYPPTPPQVLVPPKKKSEGFKELAKEEISGVEHPYGARLLRTPPTRTNSK